MLDAHLCHALHSQLINLPHKHEEDFLREEVKDSGRVLLSLIFVCIILF